MWGVAGGRPGSLTFVDLAGSERASDSMYHDPQQVQQSAEINASLAALKVRSSHSFTLACVLTQGCCHTVGTRATMTRY